MFDILDSIHKLVEHAQVGSNNVSLEWTEDILRKPRAAPRGMRTRMNK
jgi:hypothetical protein